jgi:hypothetical protein
LMVHISTLGFKCHFRIYLVERRFHRPSATRLRSYRISIIRENQQYFSCCPLSPLKTSTFFFCVALGNIIVRFEIRTKHVNKHCGAYSNMFLLIT